MHATRSAKAQEIDSCQQAPVDSSVEGQLNLTINTESLVMKSENVLFSNNERIHFYNGQDRSTYQISNIQKVRELQEANDNLQRKVMQLQKDLRDSSDPLALLAEIEHCNIMIARNTGEILKTHALNEERLERIAELEAENAKLKEEILVKRDLFINTHEMPLRSKHASEFFLVKAKIEKNISELVDLNQA